MFGFEDRLLHRLAGVTNVFTANHMQERYWPVHVSNEDIVLFFLPLTALGNRRGRGP